MSIAALIRRMAELGAPSEAIALAVEAIEAEQAASAVMEEARKAKVRERVARHREAKRYSNVTVTDVKRDTLSPLDAPLSPDTPFPPLNPPKPDETKGKRASRLPEDWSPSQADLAEAQRLGLTAAEADDQANRFRDFWHAKGGKDACKLSWPATWRNWCRTAVDRRGRAPPGRPGSPFQPTKNRTHAHDIAAAFDRLDDRIAARRAEGRRDDRDDPAEPVLRAASGR